MIGAYRTRDLSRRLLHHRATPSARSVRAASRLSPRSSSRHVLPQTVTSGTGPSSHRRSHALASAVVVRGCRRGASANSSSSAAGGKFKSEEEKLEYLRTADKTLQRYEEARQKFKRGEFPRQQAGSSQGGASSAKSLVQAGIVGAFVVAFLATPLLGKRIATDEEFRSKWIPAWYDFTVKKPENPWTREELHEQMVRVQKDLRERAIRGEFTKERLDEMRKSFEYHKFPGREDGQGASVPGPDESSATPAGWDRVHPGIDSDSDVNED
jgi:hypothetical protein